MSCRKRVLGYVILHRHGHRAPEKNIFQSTSEIDLWTSFLPSQESIDQFNERFPLRIHEKNQKPQFDVKTRPFGCITSKGVHHLQSIGSKLGKMFPGLNGVKNARVYATNYQRTQVSVQCLLHGLGATDGIPIVVRDSRNCSMSFSDEKATIVEKLIQQVQNETFILDAERILGPSILHSIPELRGGGSKNLPDSVNWMATLDYFSCRLSHSLPLPPELLEIHVPAVSYIAKRYKTETTYVEHRNFFSRPLLKELYGALLDCRNHTQLSLPASSYSIEDPAAIIFSGHDVNLLDILHVLDATVVHPDHVPEADGGGHWPDYGSTLVFELIDDSINIYYNGSPLSIHYEKTLVSSLSFHQMERLLLSLGN